jgi:hypothetical protein
MTQQLQINALRRFTKSEAIEIEAKAWINTVDSYIANYPTSLSQARRKKIRYTLLRFAKEIRKHPDEVTRPDLENFFDSRKKLAQKPWTVNNYKIILKKFYRKRKGSRFVEWIHVPKNIKPSVGPEDIISPEEHELMMHACEGVEGQSDNFNTTRKRLPAR